jgi:hypothetical protein
VVHWLERLAAIAQGGPLPPRGPPATHRQAHGKDKDKGERHYDDAQKVEDLPAPQPQHVQALRAVCQVANERRGNGVRQLASQEDCANLRAREALHAL